MQTQMEGRIDFLESQVKKLQAELGELEHTFLNLNFLTMFHCAWYHIEIDKTRQELTDVTAEKERMEREKEQQQMVLTGKIQSMERSYEAILQDALDALAGKIESARSKWDMESREMEGRAMQVLLEFGREIR